MRNKKTIVYEKYEKMTLIEFVCTITKIVHTNFRLSTCKVVCIWMS